MIVEPFADCANYAQGQSFVEHEALHAHDALHGCTEPAHVGENVWVLARPNLLLLLLL